MHCTELAAFLLPVAVQVLRFKDSYLCLQRGHVPWQKAPNPAHAAAAVKGALCIPDETSQGSHLQCRKDESI